MKEIYIKNTIRKSVAAAILGALLFTGNITTAQVGTTVTTTTSSGTIDQFSPDTLVVRSTTAANPVSYTYSKTTTYVDENGNPVSMETVRSGLPVTVYYDSEDGRMVANKVVVRKSTTTTVTPNP